MPSNGLVRISNNLQYILKTFAFPKTTTEEYLQQAIGDIIAFMKYPLKKVLLLYYGVATRNAINQISHILHRSTSQPRLQIYPYHQCYHRLRVKISYFKISQHTSTISEGKPLFKPPRVQKLQSSPTPPPRLQPYTSPSLDPHKNPWIKKSTK